MRGLYVALVHHGVVHGGVYFRMTEQPLHLFDGHTFVDGVRGKCAAELVGVHPSDAGPFPQRSNTVLNAAYADPFGGFSPKADEKSWVGVLSALDV